MDCPYSFRRHISSIKLQPGVLCILSTESALTTQKSLHRFNKWTAPTVSEDTFHPYNCGLECCVYLVQQVLFSHLKDLSKDWLNRLPFQFQTPNFIHKTLCAIPQLSQEAYHLQVEMDENVPINKMTY